MKRLKYIACLLCLMLTACHKSENHVDGLAFRMDNSTRWGLISSTGSVLVNSNTYQYQPSSVVNGMFSVPDGKGYYLLYNIDDPSHPVCPRHFFRVGYFFDNVTIAQEDDNSAFSLIDREGNTVISLNYPQYNIVLAHNFKEGLALVGTSDGKYGYIDTAGNIVIPPVYDSAYDFNEGKAIVGISDEDGDMNYQVINKKGKMLFLVQESNIVLDKQFRSGLLMYKNLKDGHCAYYDGKGKTRLYLPQNILESYGFVHQLAVCQTNSGCGIINDKGKIIFSDRYNDAFIAADNVVGLLYQGRWTVAKAGKEPAWKDVYDWIGKYYSGGYAIAQKNGRYCFINKDGEVEGQTYAMIVDDESAVPNGASQVFTRIAENSVKAFSKEGEPELPAMKDTVSSKTIAVKTRTSTVPHVVRNNSNWRSISRQSPFYSEAAKVLSGKLEETDAESRRVILNYVEHLRTSYTTKDIDFLNQLFSENALIVVGNVIRTSSERNTTYLSPSQVTYNVHSKQEYLSKLRMVFNSNKTIQVRFSDFHILRHPTVVGIYGVSLRQHYKSDRYSDDGYLFLLWDFRDASAPKIYVRTWQPYMMDNHSPLPEESVFNIRNFNLQ